jgi:hypothetical protein
VNFVEGKFADWQGSPAMYLKVGEECPTDQCGKAELRAVDAVRWSETDLNVKARRANRQGHLRPAAAAM